MTWAEYFRWVVAVLNIACCVYLMFLLAQWKQRIRTADQLVKYITDHPEDYLKGRMVKVDLWFDIDGNPVTRDVAQRLLDNSEARRIGWTVVGDWRVSTVHIVLNHQFEPGGPPLIFETMVFPPTRDTELPHGVPECIRTSNKHAALAAHDQAVAALRGAL